MDVRLVDFPDHLMGIGDWSSIYAKIAFDYLFYDNGLVYRTDSEGRDHQCKTIHEAVGEIEKATVKFEGLEKNLHLLKAAMEMKKGNIFNDCLFPTIHLFKACKDGYSFPEHTDPVDLIIYCVDGVKTMVVDGVEYEIKKGQGLIIPANTPHKATNQYDSMMLSIGFEK